MKPILIINSSARVTRSITRHLTNRFAEGWRKHYPGAEIIDRDVGSHPLQPIDEAWIAAAYAPAEKRAPEKEPALAISETLIAEIFRAEVIVAGVPMYNFGMPGHLKTYIDQIVRVGRTFAFNDDPENPYQPLIPTRPLVLITSTGTGGYEAGGPYAHWNFLEPHVEAVFRFMGLTDIRNVQVGFEELKDHQFKHSMAAAELAVDALVEQLAEPERTAVAA